MSRQIMSGLMVLAGLLAGCSQADSPVTENRQTQAVFNIQSRADGEALTDESIWSQTNIPCRTCPHNGINLPLFRYLI